MKAIRRVLLLVVAASALLGFVGAPAANADVEQRPCPGGLGFYFYETETGQSTQAITCVP
ncbi:MAG: hypothetical protein QOK43_1836 [Acidimicrobiaceae bacterium]|nr:hypothetical protein [Acidimicrobiaceae bacterium]